MLTPQISLEEQHDIPSLKKQYEDILDNFSFANLATVMTSPCKPVWNTDYTKILGYQSWTMFVGKTLKVPSESDLKQLASDLLLETINYIIKHSNEKYYMVATGPFKVVYRWGILELDAILESWSCD